MKHDKKLKLFLMTIGLVGLIGCEVAPPPPPPQYVYRSPNTTPVYYYESYPYYPYPYPYHYGPYYGWGHRHWR